MTKAQGALRPAGRQTEELIHLVDRLRRFMQKPLRQKLITLRIRSRQLWKFLNPCLPYPVWLPYGGWWLAVDDVCSDAIVAGCFEEPEWRFLESALREGMVVLDIGAHHGFYAILAAKKVGAPGHVSAFEPSLRERRRLLTHLRLNRCKNVRVEPVALASEDGESTLFVVDGRDTGCNSLRPPAVNEPTHGVAVKTIRLDTYVTTLGLRRVDFLKIDAEGAELQILEGGRSVLRRMRPVILFECDDLRTEPWGYSSRKVLELLGREQYSLFGLNHRGDVVPVADREGYNFVAIPKERLERLSGSFRESAESKRMSGAS
jgi:FkbM family methyltransferase